ncbi:MAG: ABC transporter permease [Candidatus Pelethousia sp.]|nr:ABC transporter permease [Candidatus Pelethousia sp.]
MEKTGLQSIRKTVLDYPIILFVLLAGLFGVLFVPYFLTAYNLKNLCLQLCDLLIIACGYTFIELNAGTDLSCTSVLAVGSVIGGYVMVLSPLAAFPVLAAVAGIISILLVGALFGVINALAVTKLKMPSFIATMATMLIGQAFATWFASAVYGKTSIGGLPKAFTALGGSGSFFIIPIILSIAMLLFADFLLRKTKFGRDVYSVGTNPQAAFISGINVTGTIFGMFMLCSLFASVEAIVLTARNQAGMANLGGTMFLNIVSAVVIGGTSVSGGFGGVRQTFLGSIFIVLINNAMNLIGVEWYTIMLMQGLLILLATVIDFMVKRAQKYAKRKSKGR